MSIRSLFRGGIDPVHPQQPTQLQLFASGKDIKNTVTNSFDRGGTETMDQMWDRKLDESKVEGGGHGAGVFDYVRSNPGGTKPVDINFTPNSDGTDSVSMADGHHRVASAAGAEDDTGQEHFLPIRYNDFGHGGLKMPPGESWNLSSSQREPVSPPSFDSAYEQAKPVVTKYDKLNAQGHPSIDLPL